MRQNEKDLINAYIYNNRIRLENELNQIQNNVRFRKIDIADCVEYICAKQQYDTFMEVTKHICLLLKLNKRGD